MNGLHGGVIIAGGMGKRLSPLTVKIPKPLLTVNGKSPLERCVSALEAADVKNIAITTGYLCEETEKRFSEKEILQSKTNDKKITFYREESPMGTAGMVYLISPKLEENFFVLSGDIVFDFSLKEMLDFHNSKNAAVTVATVRSHNPVDYGTVISENGIVTAFREKPSWKQVLSTRINAGVYIINRSIMEKYGKGVNDFASDLFPLLLSANETIASFDTDGYWCDMGTPDSYYKCNMYLSGGENVMGDYISISAKSEIKSSVIMNGVKVGDKSKISASIIGEGVSIGKNCVIENAVIGPYSLICDNVTVKSGGQVSCDEVVGRGKNVTGTQKSKELFSDSGKVSLSDVNDERIMVLSQALTELAKGREILIFHQGEDSSRKIYDILFESVFHRNGNPIPCGESLLPVASFSSLSRDCISVFCSSGEDEHSLFIFDEYGLPLSREDQIKCEKITYDNLDIPRTNISSSFEKDLDTAYINAKSKLKADLSEIDIITNNVILSKIIRKLGGKCETSKNTVENEKDLFFINRTGNEVYCITKEGIKIEKHSLFSIALSFYPQNTVYFPEYAPDSLKNLVSDSGFDYFVLTDSKKDRERAFGFYNYEDGISIALGVICSMAKEKKSVSELFSLVPTFAFAERTVLFNGDKGEAFEKLSESFSDQKSHTLQKQSENGKVLIIPQYRNAFRLFAEASSMETAEELLLSLEDNINALTNL